MDLASYPTLVQAPYLMVNIGGVTFGSITKSVHANVINVQYPNFIKSLQVKKINGEVNTYTIQLVYKITPGDDPNFIDRVISSVQYGNITISYGDFNYPSFIYKEEVALITDVSQNISFTSSSITYTITALGTAFKIMSNKFTFSAKTAKPSTEIFNLLKNPTFGFQDVFTGMGDLQDVLTKNLIPTDDKVVQLKGQSLISPWERLQYLVGSMLAENESKSAYRLSVVETSNKYGGSFFQVKKISVQGSMNQEEAFDLTIGYPTNNFITNFAIQTSQGWSLLYNTSANDQNTNIQYTLDLDGNMVTKFSPTATRSPNLLVGTAQSESWWNDMINFPIKAEITLKGLVAPTILLAYTNIDVMFYGAKHITSGMYFITEQVDTIDSSGYKTTLKLQRVPRDEKTDETSVTTPYSGK